MLGSTAAHAVKVCTAAPTDRAGLDAATCADSMTFASETALDLASATTMASDNSDTTAYYNIADNAIVLAGAGRHWGRGR